MSNDSRTDELTTHAARRLGTTVRGKYRLDAIIGVGGMAVVYRATHRNQAEFALKMLHPEFSVRQDVWTRFIREGYAANGVKHPGVVLVVDDDVAEDGAAFLVMELLDGIGCEALLERSGPVPVDALCAIGDQLLDVLASAHGKGIVHRDLKPANLFVTREGRLKVLDFGIARVRDAASGNATVTGMLLGTPAFMGPEQALAKTADIDAVTDLWAVGATLFTLATGQLVHEADNAQQILVKAATQKPRSIRSAALSIPARVADVIDRALEFDKSDRWQSAVDMRDALREAAIATFGRALSSTTLSALLVNPTTTAGFPRQEGAPRVVERTVPLAVPPRRPSDHSAQAMEAISATVPEAVSTRPRPQPHLEASAHDAATADPVSRHVAPAERPVRSKVLIALGALLVAGAAGAVFVRFGTGRPTETSATGTTLVQPPNVPAVTALPIPSTSLAPSLPTPQESASSREGAVVAQPQPTSTQPTIPITRKPVVPAASAARAPAAPTLAPTASATPRCKNVSFVAADGETHFKKVCE